MSYQLRYFVRCQFQITVPSFVSYQLRYFVRCQFQITVPSFVSYQLRYFVRCQFQITVPSFVSYQLTYYVRCQFEVRFNQSQNISHQSWQFWPPKPKVDARSNSPKGCNQKNIKSWLRPTCSSHSFVSLQILHQNLVRARKWNKTDLQRHEWLYRTIQRPVPFGRYPEFSYLPNTPYIGIIVIYNIYTNLWLVLDNWPLWLSWLERCIGIAGPQVRFLPESL